MVSIDTDDKMMGTGQGHYGFVLKAWSVECVPTVLLKPMARHHRVEGECDEVEVKDLIVKGSGNG